jgi:hypothetical protein
MTKLLLAMALAAVVATPALAALENPQGRPLQHQFDSISAHQGKLLPMQSRSARGEAVDPYWTPCNYHSLGDNGCE